MINPKRNGDDSPLLYWYPFIEQCEDVTGFEWYDQDGSGFGDPPKYLDVTKYDWEHALHEVGHWLFATEEERVRPNLGLLEEDYDTWFDETIPGMSPETLMDREFGAVWFTVRAVMETWNKSFDEARMFICQQSEHAIPPVQMDSIEDRPEIWKALEEDALLAIETFKGPLRDLVEDLEYDNEEDE